MATKQLDELTSTTSLVGNDILHTKEDTTGNDKRIKIKDYHLNQGIERYFPTVASMQADDGLQTGMLVRIKELADSLWDVGSYTANGTTIREATSSGLQVQLREQQVMSLRAFGTTGDDVADDNAAIQAAFSSKARVLLGHPDDIYRSNSQLTMGEGQILNLCGAELKFYESGLVRYLVTNNNCVVENGTVRSSTSDVTVRGAEYQQPICIGFSNSLTDFVENVIVRNIILSSTSPEGNALFVFGACNNILCENIVIEAGSALGEPIGGHWSVEPGGDETQGTGHPNNVTFRNIKIGAQTYGGAGAIFLSAVRKFTFENIEVEAFTGDGVVQIFAGDHGFKYANDTFGEDFGCEIELKNIQGVGTKGVVIQLRDTLEDQIVWPSNIRLNGVAMQSSSTTTTTSRGLELGSVANVTVDNSSFDLFYNGLFFNGSATGIRISDTKFTNSYKNGVDADNSAGCANLTFYKVRFDGSNTATGTGYDMLFGSYIDGITLDECVFNSPSTTFAFFTDTSAPPRNVRVMNSHVEDCGGTAFVFGNSSSYGICELFTGNTLADDLDQNIRGGQDLVPYSSTGIQNNKLPMREFIGPGSAPSFGTYHPGDRIYDEAPSASGKIGLVCVIGGTEHTYSEGLTATTDGTTTVVLSAASNVIRKNDYVTINSTNVRVLSISGTTMIVSATIAAGSGLAITFTGGTYKPFGAIDA